MEIYKELQGVANGLLQEFRQGQIALVRWFPGTGPAYDPGEPVPVRTLLKTGVAKGVLYKYVQQGLAAAGDSQVTIAANEVEPSLADTVEIDGRPFKIVQIIPKPLAGTPVVFVLIVRA